MPCCLDNPCIKDDFVKKIDEIRMTMTCKHLARRCARLEGNGILAPAYNEFGYNEHQAVTRRFLCIKITDSNVEKFGYNDQFLLHLFTHCKRDPVYNGSHSQCYLVTKSKFLQMTTPLVSFPPKTTSKSVTNELVVSGIQYNGGLYYAINDTAEPPK